MQYDVYDCPFYHNGEVVFKPDAIGKLRCVGFKSNETGRTYPIKRLEPEAFMLINDLFNSGDLSVDGNHYVEDVTIVHEVSGECSYDAYGETVEVGDTWFDGKPTSDFEMSDDFIMAIDDLVYHKFLSESE